MSKLRRNAAMAVLALLVAGLFLARRLSGPDGGAPAFDPADFRDAPTAPAEAAARYVGERAVICGTVAAVSFARDVGGQPTFLNLGRPFPDQEFDVVIWGRDRQRFELPPERVYDRASVCVAGTVTEHRGVPRIEVRVPAQIRIMRGS